MATFVSLLTFTQHGEADISHSVDRASAFRETAKQHGAEVKDVYWTLGGFDGVVIFDAPDDETATSLMLGLGAQGNVRTKTMRAFNADEITAILSPKS